MTISYKKRSIISSLVGLLLVCSVPVMAGKPITVTERDLWSDYSATSSDPVMTLMRERPDIRVKAWGGLSLPGAAGRSTLMMGIAGNSGPDAFLGWFHIIRSDVDQGFLYPLNEWIGKDKNGDGQISDSESIWTGWKRVPKLLRQVSTVNGKVYGVPLSSTYYIGIVYRIDLVKKAGLDPNKPPRTWDEFMYWSQKLTYPNKIIPGSPVPRGQRGFSCISQGFMWLPWLNSAGGSPLIQYRKSPKTGKTYSFSMEATEFVAPDTHEDLSQVPPSWRADFASDAGQRAMGFYHRLRWQKWIRDPGTGEPVNLTNEQAASGSVKVGSRTVAFKPEDVIVGAMRPSLTPQDNVFEMLARGEVAMLEWYYQDLKGTFTSVGLNPELLAVCPFPAGPGGRQVVQRQQHFAVATESIGRRPKRERDAVWELVRRFGDQRAYDENVKSQVLFGQARFCNPSDLTRLGFGDYVREIPTSMQQMYKDIDNGKVWVRTEPFVGYWVSMDIAIMSNVTTLIFSDSGEKFDYVKALKNTQTEANSGVMFKRSDKELSRYRPVAGVIVGIVGLFLVVIVVLLIRANMVQVTRAGSKAGAYPKWLPWLLLLPALASIAAWGYYPLLRGLVMAFQDYHIVGESKMIGLDNFIDVFLNPNFYIYISKTCKFVALNFVLAFFTPIILALLLAEVPKLKVFFRTLFFLPQMTSPLVVTLLWKTIYDPTESGLLNQILAFMHIARQDWLGNPSFAMAATILPGVWAGSGLASLIYLAALKSVPEEVYEAADLDAAGMWAKLRYMVWPSLLPLILINFLGTTIGTFQSMGNIFLLTFGGPGKETMVLPLAIWIEAYNNLRFSVATSMAWVMGTALISLSYLQIRLLRKVDFRRAEIE